MGHWSRRDRSELAASQTPESYSKLNCKGEKKTFAEKSSCKQNEAYIQNPEDMA